jgi:hypothetical protein
MTIILDRKIWFISRRRWMVNIAKDNGASLANGCHGVHPNLGVNSTDMVNRLVTPDCHKTPLSPTDSLLLGKRHYPPPSVSP